MQHLLRRLIPGLALLLLLPLLAFTALRTQPGPIVQMSPRQGATDVWLGTTVRVTFAVPVDRNSVETHFVVDPAVAGTFTWHTDSQGETVEFKPNDILKAATTHRVTLQADLRDARGNVVLDTDYTWTFTTRQGHDVIDFGYGLPIQLVDPDGRRSVEFSAGYSRIRVNLALYALPLNDFAGRYADLTYSGDLPIDIAGLTQETAWQQDFNNPEDYSLHTIELPESVPPGLYVLVAQHPNAGQDELIVALSRHALALKRSAGGQVVVWAMQLQDQIPTAGMTVGLYDEEGALIVDGDTSEDGVADLDAGDAEPRLAVGQLGDNITVAGLDGAWRTRGGYWYWWRNDRADTYRVYLYTDRPIYRPGHTVHFAGILRHDRDGTYTPVEASQPVSVTLRDSRNNVVDSKVLPTDEFGTVKDSFTLGDEPAMGTYTIELVIDDTTQRQEFRVEAYRKPEYEVDVTPSVSYAVAGDDVSVTVQSDYFFGQPVAGADVVFKIYRRSGRWYWWGSNYGDQIAELRGTTDSDGQWTTNFTTTGTREEDAVYTFLASVTDASRQPIDGRAVLPVYWNTFRLNLSTDKYGYDLDETVLAQIAVVRHDGAPVAGQDVAVTVERGYDDPEIVAQEEVTTDEDGQAQASFTGLAQGWYHIRAVTVDDRNRRAESRRYLWVYDRGGSGWWYSSDDELSIDTDRDAYAPGDTAQLLIESRVAGVALLTLERGSVYEEQIVHLEGPATTVELDIRDDFAPNIFVRLHIFTTDVDTYYSQNTPEGRLLTAYTEIPVSAESNRLSVSVMPDAEQYQPGDQAELTLQVTDAAGQPVDALVGLAVVDEAIFALSEDLSTDIFEHFYGSRSNTVATYDSLSLRRYIWRYLEDNFRGTATPSPTGTPAATPAPAEPSDDTGQNLRQKFRDTAYWAPAIEVTNGEAVVTVDLPDNLTTWRIIARAVTLDTKVGDARANILVTKDLIARPALPRFTVLGDQFALDTIAQNFSGQALTGTVTLDAPDLVVLDPGTRSVDLPHAGAGVARWTAVASEVGEGTITCAVDTAAGGDAVQLPLRTKPFAVPERWSAAGMADPTATQRFEVPFNAVHEATELTLRLSPSVALGVLDGLDALIDYPYGCVEQTMSRVLPSAVAARTYSELGIPNPKADELPDIIDQGVQRLYGFQHANGGWGWWYDDDGNMYMTAYVLFGLTMVEQAGFDVDDDVLQRGFSYLDSRLYGAEDPRVAAYVLYVKSVAGRGDLAAAQELLSDNDRLDTFSRAALALTLFLEGDTINSEVLIDQLIAEVEETPIRAYWPADRKHWGEYYWRTMSSTEKNTAMALRTLIALRPDEPLLPKVVRWLMDQRRGRGWRDTQATAFAVLGLTDFIQVSGELEANYVYTVSLNGQTIAVGQVTRETVTDPIDPIVIAGDQLVDGENQLRIERSDSGQLYYSLWLTLQLFYDGFESVSSIDQGLAIRRSYHPVESDQEERDTYDVGDLVEVQLTLEADIDAWYVVIEDPLPAGFEALNERMNPVAYGDDFAPWRWYEWGYNRKNIYDDKVAFFVTHLWPGERRYSYMMRATTPGKFSVLPAEAYPMYDAEIWGRSGSHQVAVAPNSLMERPVLAGDFDRSCRLTSFDTRQAIGAWGTSNLARDLNGDGDVGLQDVAAVASRQGATCLADQPVPGAGEGRADFVVSPEVDSIQVGQAFEVDVTLKDATDLGGFGLTLSFDAKRMRTSEVTLAPALADALSLGPRIDNEAGRVALGAIDLPADLASDSKVATITFVGRHVGEAEFAVGNTEAIDGDGRTLEAGATVTAQVRVGGVTYYFPLLIR